MFHYPCADSRLSVLNGSLTDAVISGPGIRFQSLGTYCVGVVFNSDVTLQGVFQAGSGVSFNGNIINNGVMRNRSNNSYGIQVQGGLENNGSILNYIYNFTMIILGDIHNNGTWSNYLTILDGTTNQNIYLINGNAIQGQIRLDANFTGSSFAWWGPQGNLVGNASFSGASTQNLNFLNPVTNAYSGQYYCKNNLSINSRSIFITTLVIPVRTLNLTVLLEGLYNGSGAMNQVLDAGGNAIWQANIADQITVDFHETNNFETVFLSVSDVFLKTDGTAALTIPAVFNGNYYISIKHRNSVETVSAIPIDFSGNVSSFNFTGSASQAYGANQKDLNGNGSAWGFYSGDVTSISGGQDAYVDFFNLNQIYNRNVVSASGYQVSDLTGDGYVDFFDLNLIYNNSVNSIGIITP